MSGLGASEEAELEMLQHIQHTIEANVTRKSQAESISDSVAVLKGRLKDLEK